MKKTMLICGYGPGVSHAVARRFAKAGHPIALVARNTERLNTAVEQLSREGIQVQAFSADLSDPTAVQRVVRQTQAALGSIGILHWNAFLDVEGDLLNMPISDLSQTLTVRVVGYIAAVQACIADLESHQGSVLATSGIMALDEPHINAFATGYAALAIGAASQHKATSLLTQTLAARNVYVGEVIVNGFIEGTPGGVGKSGCASPIDIAEQFWKLHSTRHTHSVILDGNVSVAEAVQHAQKQAN